MRVTPNPRVQSKGSLWNVTIVLKNAVC
ncbi:hypothetical protein AVEN_131438-1, partial [Araneus ventricosus]